MARHAARLAGRGGETRPAYSGRGSSGCKMSYTIEKVYESEQKNETVSIVLWVSRHPPLRSQTEELERRLGSITIYQMSGLVPNAEAVVEVAKKVDAKYVVPVLPLSMVTRLSELAKQSGLTILIAKMNNIASVKDFEEAKRIVSEKPMSRTLATYADGLVRVFEFERFERLVRVELVTEPF